MPVSHHHRIDRRRAPRQRWDAEKSPDHSLPTAAGKQALGDSPMTLVQLSPVVNPPGCFLGVVDAQPETAEPVRPQVLPRDRPRARTPVSGNP